MRARSQAARRRKVEPSGGELTGIPDGATPMDGELAAILDQEVNRLPAKYRSPIVLCYLQGLTHEEAARQLNWPLGSVKGRLAGETCALAFAASRNRRRAGSTSRRIDRPRSVGRRGP